VSGRLFSRNGITRVAAAVALLGAGWLTGITHASASSSSLPGLYGSLPPTGGAAKSGGVLTVGQVAGSTPTYIFPITPAAQTSVYTDNLEYPLYPPLYWPTTGSEPKIDETYSLAQLPVYSDGGKTVTISMKQGYKWSNGAPVDANDVVFFLDLLKAAVKESAANFGNYTPGFLPDNLVSSTATSKYTVQLKLTKAYNPGYFTNDQLQSEVTPLPSTAWDVDATGGPKVDYTQPANAKLIYNYLAAQAKKLTTYATNPLWQDIDGPLKLTSYTPATGAFTMVPNPTYGGPVKAKYATIKYETFTSFEALFNQLVSGTLDIGQVDFSVLPQVSRITSKYSVFGYPEFGFNAAFYNFKDKTGDWNNVIAQTYIRQVFSQLQDQPGIVKGLLKGAGGPVYGPVPSIPVSPFTPSNAKTAPWPYSVSGAAKVLTAHGWKVVPNGKTTCAKPGTGAGECGAGIPAGTAIAPNLFYANTPPVTGQEAEALAAAAKGVGINISLISKTFNFILSNYSVVSSPANNDKWAIEDFGGFTNDAYPTTNDLFNTGGSFNQGGYSSAEANKLINTSVYGTKQSAVTAEASYLTNQQPALFGPATDYIWAISKSVSATDADAFESLTQLFPTPQAWYFKG
jgi:peptide/nickel transport system substrate-binding protein